MVVLRKVIVSNVKKRFDS